MRARTPPKVLSSLWRKRRREIGIRGSFSMEVSDRDGEKITDAEIKENVDFIKAMNTDEQDMIKGMFGMHASFTISGQDDGENRQIDGRHRCRLPRSRR